VKKMNQVLSAIS